MLLDIVLMVVCLGFSAFFSASETALTALDSVKTQKIIEKGGTFSKALRLWLDEPLKVLTCILIGNNIVNVAASALATDLARQGLAGSGYEETALPLAIGGMTLLLLTFGEITPKTIAKARSEDLAGRMIWALRIPYLLFFPITVAFTWLTRSLMKLGGEDLDDQTRHEVTEEDIEYLVELGSRGGQLEDRKERILQSVFEYTTTKVREIMIPRIEVVAVPQDGNLEDILDMVISSGHSRLPVYEETVDNIVGLFYAKDLLRHILKCGVDSSEAFHFEDFIRPAYFVPESKKISDLLTEFQKGRIHMAIVVGEFGGTSGLITLEDIIEEFFGDIQDEYDTEEDYFQVLGEGHLLVAGRCPLDALEEILDMTFPAHPDYDSLAGFILAQVGSMPTVGTKIELDGYRFEVTESDAKRVIQVDIKKNETREAGEENDLQSRLAG